MPVVGIPVSIYDVVTEDDPHEKYKKAISGMAGEVAGWIPVVGIVAGPAVEAAVGRMIDINKDRGPSRIWDEDRSYGENVKNEFDTFLINPRALTLCFVKGTPILTQFGEVPIERLKVGDKVMSF